MELTEETKQKIKDEYAAFEAVQYAGKTKEERSNLGAFFTPAELSIKMIEKYDNLKGTILDPTCGAGGLLAAAIIAGADSKKCYGIELDEKILKIAQHRLGQLGVPEKNLHQGDALKDSCYQFPTEDNETYEYDAKSHCGKLLKNGKAAFRFGGMK